MGIYVNNMEMPECCDDCFIDECACDLWEDMDCQQRGVKRHSDCPLVEVPEPHGYLIDKSELISREYGWYKASVDKMEDAIKIFVAHAIEGIDKSPTVIEEEGE